MRRVTVLVLGLITGLILAGCSTTGSPVAAGSGSNTSGSGLVKRASMAELATAVEAQSKADQTVRATIRVQVPGAGTITGEGVQRVDSAGIATSFRMNIPGTGGATEPFELIVLPPAGFYVKIAGGSPDPGKPWIKISPTGTDPLSKALAPVLTQLRENADPLSNVQRFGTTTITDVAEESVDGVPTLRYKLHVDLTNSTDKSAVDLRRVGVTTLEPTLWLGEKDRVVKFVIITPIPGAGNTETEGRFSDWGKPVVISPPPADQVAAI